jgi:hypothetical protein
MGNIEHAIEALKFMQGWSIWLVGIQTGAIGFIGILYKNGFKARKERWVVGATLSCFGVSILSAMVVHGGIPSVASRLLFINDISQIPERSIFALQFPRTWCTPLFFWGHLEAIFFVLGIILFSFSMWVHASIVKRLTEKDEI